MISNRLHQMVHPSNYRRPTNNPTIVRFTAKNLPSRQRELNDQVNEAFATNVPLEEIRHQDETSDVDVFFKIHLAAKHKEVDYILHNIFKSGDELYISRVLKKCKWLFNDKYTTLINPDYMEKYIFPDMSTRMIIKFFNVLSKHIKNSDRAEDRAEHFYEYCSKYHMRLSGYKLLLFTSESFKIVMMREKLHTSIRSNNSKYWRKFIGNSFVIFEEFLQLRAYNKNEVIRSCSHLFTVSSERFLDLLERHVNVRSANLFKLGLKTSTAIVKHHKQRIMARPNLYANILNLDSLLRYSLPNDVERYGLYVLPRRVIEFWNDEHHQKRFRKLISSFPERERLDYAKRVYALRYNEEFEMSNNFIDAKYYNLMTPQERETWALRNLANAFLGFGNDYTWFQYTMFDTTFTGITNLLRQTLDPTRLFRLFEVLVKAAKTNLEIERVLNHYFIFYAYFDVDIRKPDFLLLVLNNQNVFEFDELCWNAYYRIASTIEANTPGCKFKVVTLLYKIVNDKAMTIDLVEYMDVHIEMSSLDKYLMNFNVETTQKIYDYFLDFYKIKILRFDSNSNDRNLLRYIKLLKDLISVFSKTRADIPHDLLPYIGEYLVEENEEPVMINEPVSQLSEKQLLEYLKVDVRKVIEKMPQLKKYIASSWGVILKRFISKVKIYFSKDLAQVLLTCCINVVNENSALGVCSGIDTAVYAIFQLADESFKIRFFMRYAPDSETIIPHRNKSILYLKKAICQFASFSRPTFHHNNILMYMKGDYMKYCVPVINRYCTTLPNKSCFSFIKTLINSPVEEIQQHGIRLAYNLNLTNTMKLVLDIWRNTTNTSIRKILYKSVFDKIAYEQVDDLCDFLKMLTSELRDTDDVTCLSVFSKIHKLPLYFISEYTDVLWRTVKGFQDTEQNLATKAELLKQMDDKIHCIRVETLESIVTEHINSFPFARVVQLRGKERYFYLAQRDFVLHYIAYRSETHTERSEGIAIAKILLGAYFRHWNVSVNYSFIGRKMYQEFIRVLNAPRYLPEDDKLFDILPRCSRPDANIFVNCLPLFEAILTDLEATFPLNLVYNQVWDLRINIANRQVINENLTLRQRDVMTTAATEFGRRVGNTIRESVESNTYQYYFSKNLCDALYNGVQNIEKYLRGSELRDDVDDPDIIVSLCSGILEVNTKATCLIALILLPLNPTRDLDLYTSAYSTIREYPDVDIRRLMHSKFRVDVEPME
ncbi:uncharacterized protein LOC114354121 [Ostrinia furnacalis]|uniref:uncharacterized protein LOC114354121 n=1 Tax=Ostrinia furnacalis TaxID=93504 RepID=UPI00103BE8AC|nr:uncharacterized protein LOC114354121 [Ostrinia furnacalis]